ncbi:MAG: hypothetical protein V4512_14195 [Pseudomonadota bacterium]
MALKAASVIPTEARGIGNSQAHGQLSGRKAFHHVQKMVVSAVATIMVQTAAEHAKAMKNPRTDAEETISSIATSPFILTSQPTGAFRYVKFTKLINHESQKTYRFRRFFPIAVVDRLDQSETDQRCRAEYVHHKVIFAATAHMFDCGAA